MKIKVNGTIIPSNDQWIYDWLEIEAASPLKIERELEKAEGAEVDIYINSGGGDVFAGSEIYDMIRRYNGKKKIHVTGVAASAASVILCACESDIAPTGMVMVHNVSGGAYGDYNAMDKESEILQKANRAIAAAYMTKTGMTEEEALDLMNRETWMTAQEAVEHGLVNEVAGESVNLQLIAAAGACNILPRDTIEKIRNTIQNPERGLDIDRAKAQAKLNLLNLTEGKR